VRYCSQCGARLPHPPGDSPHVSCEACGITHWRNAKPCAGALVEHDGRLLLVRRATEPWLGRFDIPGGFCEPDEHPEQTAVREVREETGLEIEVTSFLGIWLDGYPHPDEVATTTMNVYYRAVVVGGEERPDPGEVDELGWFSPDELPAEIAFPDHASQVLAAWRRELGPENRA